jgi:xylulokinase
MGEVPASIAAEIGVKPGAKLISGGHDHTAASLGVGLCKPGQMMNEIGTVDTMMLLTNDLSKLTAPNSTLNFSPHVTVGNFSVGGGNLTGGVILKWFRDHFAKLEKSEWAAEGLPFYREYDKRIPPEPTDLIVLPRFSTGSASKAEFAGIMNLTLATTNEQIYRAFMEGEAYEMYTQFKRLNEKVSKVKNVIALGGGANCDAYMQIRSDVFNVPFATVNTEQAGTHGDAMLAGISVGVYKNIEEAIATAVSIKKTFEPNPKNHDYYMGMYEKYVRFYQAASETLWPEA